MLHAGSNQEYRIVRREMCRRIENLSSYCRGVKSARASVLLRRVAPSGRHQNNVGRSLA